MPPSRHGCARRSSDEVAELGHVGLATVLVGDDPASGGVHPPQAQGRARRQASRRSTTGCPRTTTEDELVELVQQLHEDDVVDGILVQTPLPDQIDEARVMLAIDR